MMEYFEKFWHIHVSVDAPSFLSAMFLQKALIVSVFGPFESKSRKRLIIITTLDALLITGKTIPFHILFENSARLIENNSKLNENLVNSHLDSQCPDEQKVRSVFGKIKNPKYVHHTSRAVIGCKTGGARVNCPIGGYKLVIQQIGVEASIM
ncbi:MAG: hypothetical protein MHMPM18_002045 [Marteilia pararefringens]